MFRGIGRTILEAVKSLVPVLLAVVILQFTILHVPITTFLQFLGGSILVLAGIILFLTGVKVGVIPVGRDIGAELPKRGSLLFIILAAAVLGFTVVIAEPGVLVLENMVEAAADSNSMNPIIFIIATGATLFIVMALLRILLDIDIRYLLAVSYGAIAILAFFVPADFVSIAFDSGGVTAGPLTVPMFLALGLGFTSVLARRTQFMDGFGLIGLACAGPVIGLMLWGVILSLL